MTLSKAGGGMDPSVLSGRACPAPGTKRTELNAFLSLAFLLPLSWIVGQAHLRPLSASRALNLRFTQNEQEKANLLADLKQTSEHAREEKGLGVRHLMSPDPCALEAPPPGFSSASGAEDRRKPF